MKQPLFIALIVTVIAQWLVPGSIIFRRSEILDKGVLYKFLTEPIDPSDPFKGRYVALNFRESQFSVPDTKKFINGQEVYLRVGNDERGFARIVSISSRSPAAGNNYIKANIAYISAAYDAIPAMVHIKFPFQEYYMNEFKAPKAEKIYREANRANRADSADTYANVKVYRGGAVVEDLIINGKSISDQLK